MKTRKEFLSVLFKNKVYDMASDIAEQVLKSINEHLAREFERIFSAPYHGDTYYDQTPINKEITLEEWANKVHPTKEIQQSVENESKVDLGSCLIFGATMLGAIVASTSNTNSGVRVSTNTTETTNEVLEEETRRV